MNSDLDQGLVSPTRSFVEDGGGAGDADGQARTEEEEEIINLSERDGARLLPDRN